MNQPSIKVIIADDHDMILQGITSMLDKNPRYHITGTANNGNQVLEILKSRCADIVLFDVSMPEMDGLALLKILKKDYPQIKAVAFTQYGEIWNINNLLKEGVDGILLKATEKAVLMTALTEIAAGKRYFCEEVKNTLIESKTPGAKSRYSKFEINLTEREKEVLALIAQEFTTAEIADKLFLSSNTIETHRKNLILKFGVRNVAGLVKAALEKGFI